MAFTFNSDLVSDLHKDAYGFRPSPDFWDMWKNGLTDEGRQAEWDYLCKKVEQDIEREKAEALAAVEEFDAELASILKVCPKSHVNDAIAYMTPAEFEDNPNLNSQDIEHWVWQRGILFTDRGREVVEIVKRIYGVK